jgi:multiple sugar transport system permease protein
MRRRKRSFVYWLCLAPLMLVILFPFAVMITTAIRPRAEILTFPPVWIPSHVRLRNFVEMWQAVGFGQALVNSAIVSAAGTALALLIALPAAYATARLSFAGKRLYQQALLVTQMLSPIVLILGIFRLMAAMGLVDRMPGLVLAYAAFNLAFAIWMLQAYFRTIPKELEEAAILDGATALQRFRLVFLPLAAPALGVTTVFVFIYCWNEFVLALSILRSPDKYTLPLQIFALVGGRYSVEWDHVMAATLLATVPAAVVFAALQRYLVRGLALGAIK